ncbi:MAG: flagellar protein FlgN [Burkholderiales bacterium]|nr:flagellar protein FlgN [Burkholderiales bacterium]
MNSSATTPASSLKDESQAARVLIDLLKKEQAMLVAAEIEGLPALTEEKAKIVSHLSELASRRHNALAAAGFAPQETGMQEWLKKNAIAAASSAWKELMDLAKSGRELNRINGMLINKHLARNQQAINVLQVGPQEGHAFYGPNGQSTVKTTVRGLAIG